MSSSDLTFFTNEPSATLLDRFKATLKDTNLFDVIVGYFRASGFYQLQDSIAPIGKTRILIGLGNAQAGAIPLLRMVAAFDDPLRGCSAVRTDLLRPSNNPAR